MKPIPSLIYCIFQSVIDARRSTHSVFQQLGATKSDPEIEKSNASYLHFIEILKQAFAALGGNSLSTKQNTDNEDWEEEDVKDVIFSNKFSSLDIDTSNEVESDDPESPATSSANFRKKSGGRGKKGKRGKRPNGKKRPAAMEANVDELPLENYRIIEDENG